MKHVSLIIFVVLQYGTVAAVGAAIVFATFHERALSSFGNTARSSYYPYETGWPLTYSTRLSKQSVRPPPSKSVIDSSPRELSPLAVSVDLVCSLVLVSCSFVVARYVLPNLRRVQFSIASLMYLMFVTAIVCLIVRYEHDSAKRMLALFGTGLNAYYPITLYSFWVFVPVLYTIGCAMIVAYFGVRGVLAAGSKMMSPTKPNSANK